MGLELGQQLSSTELRTTEFAPALEAELVTKEEPAPARDDFADDSALAKAIGIIIFQQGDFARAATLLKACAASSSTDPEIFYYLGAAQLKAGQRPAAKANLQQAIALKLSGPLADSARQMLTELK